MAKFPIEIDPKIGARFKLVRKYLNLNQEHMAELCEIKQSMSSYIESGKRDLPTTALQNLFLKKNISPTYLLVGKGDIEFSRPEGETQVSSKLKYMEADIEILKGEIERLKKATTIAPL